MAIVRFAGDRFVGLSTDTKPTSVLEGAIFEETDTLIRYIYTANEWKALDKIENIVKRVKNTSGSTLAVGTAVRITGATGENPNVTVSNATSDGVPDRANGVKNIIFGITTESINNNAVGEILIKGTLKGYNTNAFNVGDFLFVPATGTTFTTTPPAPPAYAICVGLVVKKAEDGEVCVNVQEPIHINDITGIDLTRATLADKQVMVYNGSKFVNRLLDKADVGLGNVDNTSDLNKPISTATQTALDLKADKLPIVDVSAAAAGTLGDLRVLSRVIDGVLDTGFDPNANNEIYAIAIQSDGKIVVGGLFTTVGGTTRNRIVRVNSDGTLDTGFDPNVSGQVNAIAIQSDGKIVIGGAFTNVGGVTRNRIARLNSDGTLDTGFDPNANSEVNTTAIQSDGKIVIGGFFTTVGGVTRNRIARLNTDGTLDTGFDPNASSTIRAISIQSDGKIVIGGFFTTVGGTTRNRIARFNTDGTLDTGFNPNANEWLNAIAIQSDGKIIIGGVFNTVGGVTRNRIARLNTDGTLDTGFNPNAGGQVLTTTIQSDGKIVIGGDFTTVGGTTRNRIARLNTDGTLDTGFDPNASSGVRDTAIQSDGKIVIGGNFTTVGGTTRNFIARLAVETIYGQYLYTDTWKLISTEVL